jgi:type IV secretion system protein VirD4
MPEAINSNAIAVDSETFPMLAEAALTRLGCRDFRYNKSFRQITAKDEERFPGRYNWLINYNILIRWARSDSDLVFDVSVADDRNSWSESFCQKRAAQIVQAICQDSKQEMEPAKPSSLYGSARLAREADLKHASYLTEAPDSTQLLVAPWSDHECLAIPRHQTSWHAFVCGPTGGGKSSGLFIPNLLVRIGSSAIVTEATAGEEAPELYMKTAGWRAHHGHRIYHFDPSDISSTRLNPMDAVLKAPDHKRAALADMLANLIIVNTTPEGSTRADPIWDRNERHLLFVLIMHMVAKDPANAHFGAIRRLLAQSEKDIAIELHNSPSPLACREYQAFVGHSSDNYRHGVFSGLISRLNPWVTERIVRITCATDLDIEQLQNELFTFYFSVPSRRSDLKPIAALMLNFLIDIALSANFKNPLTLVLDEFTNFGYIPGIDQALSIIRRREMSAILGVQDFRQLKVVYGRDRAEIIASQPGTRIFFQPRDFKTAKEISDGLGQQTVLDTKFTDRGSVIERELGRPLMTASELMELGDQILVLTPSCPPVVCKRFTYKTMPAPENMPPPAQPEHPLLSEYAEFERQAKDQQQKLKKSEELTEEEKLIAEIQTTTLLLAKSDEENNTERTAALHGILIALGQKLEILQAQKRLATSASTEQSSGDSELKKEGDERSHDAAKSEDNKEDDEREDREDEHGEPRVQRRLVDEDDFFLAGL